jgi:predicted DNA-binding protein with PD1-like motif
MSAIVETGTFGRTISLRVAPNEDLTEAIEKVCAAQGISRAMIRCGIGSMIDGCLEVGRGRDRIEIPGPAVEVLTLLGEVRPGEDGAPRACLSGTVADPMGRVSGGRFVRGRNRICITAEIVFQEWLPADSGQAVHTTRSEP